ncbi:MAG: YggT family protein [bacterium]|nr:YggT family protein [bacterium]
MNSYTSATTKPLFKATQIVWYLLSLLEVLLAFRFVLKLMEANPAAGFTNFIYQATWLATTPFLAVFPRTYIEGSIFEWTTLLAMAVYWIVALAIVRLFQMSKTVSIPEAAAKLEE